jgi:hypothetical protein
MARFYHTTAPPLCTTRPHLAGVQGVGCRAASSEPSSRAQRSLLYEVYGGRLPDWLHPDDLQYLLTNLPRTPGGPAASSAHTGGAQSHPDGATTASATGPDHEDGEAPHDVLQGLHFQLIEPHEPDSAFPDHASAGHASSESWHRAAGAGEGGASRHRTRADSSATGQSTSASRGSGHHHGGTHTAAAAGSPYERRGSGREPPSSEAAAGRRPHTPGSGPAQAQSCADAARSASNGAASSSSSSSAGGRAGTRGSEWFRKRWPRGSVGYDEYAEVLGAAPQGRGATPQGRAGAGRRGGKYYRSFEESRRDWDDDDDGGDAADWAQDAR